MTNVLVTGGAGFIGSNLVDSLLDNDFNVRVLDNLSTGSLKNLPKNVDFIKGDIASEEIVKKSLKDIDIIFHFAAQASVAISMKKPLLDANVNTLGTLNLLEKAHQSEIDQLIFSSTGGAIYGEPQYLPPDENHKEEPISIYGASKLAAEKYMQFYQKLGLKSSILRFSNVYGPRQDPYGEAGVISIFLGNIMAGKPIHVFGDGTSSRDYVFVKDVAKVAIDVIQKPTGQPMNVGSGKETIMNELIQAIKNVVQKDIKVIYGDVRSGDVKNVYLNCNKLKNHLGWIPSTPLEEGLQQVWNWFKANKK